MHNILIFISPGPHPFEYFENSIGQHGIMSIGIFKIFIRVSAILDRIPLEKYSMPLASIRFLEAVLSLQRLMFQ